MSTGRQQSRGARRTLQLVFLAVLLFALLAVAGCGFMPDARASALYPLQWRPAMSLPAHVASFVFAPSSRNVGYACSVATGAVQVAPAATPPKKPAPTPTVAYRSVVYRSPDGGMTWDALATPFPGGRACRVFVAALDADDVFVAQPASVSDESGLLPAVWRSRDGGKTWQSLDQIAQPEERSSVAAMAVVGQRLVAEATSTGIPAHLYASADDGKTWQALSTQLHLSGLYAVGATLYATGEGNGGGNGESAGQASGASGSGTSPAATLYHSADGGLTWTPMTVPYPDVGGLAFTLAGDAVHTYGVGLIPAATAYGVNAHAVIVSKDGGATWTRVDAPPSVGTLGVVLLPDGTLLVQSQLRETQPAGGFTAEVFRLRPGETAWQLIGLGPYVTGWQVARVSAAGGAATRLWGAAPAPASPATYVWADVP